MSTNETDASISLHSPSSRRVISDVSLSLGITRRITLTLIVVMSSKNLKEIQDLSPVEISNDLIAL